MERQKCRFHLWIVWCVIGFASISNGDIQCPDDSPINCPNTVNCCKLDQFCHTGICTDCPLKNISKEKLLITCRNMTLKDMNISSEIQLSCLHMCHVHFTTEEINKYLQERIETLKKETAYLSNRIKEIGADIQKEKLNLQERIETLKKETAYLPNRIKEIDETVSSLNSGIIAIRVILVVIGGIIFGTAAFFRWKQLKNKKVLRHEDAELKKLLETDNEANLKGIKDAIDASKNNNQEEMQKLIVSENRRNEETLKNLTEDLRKDIEEMQERDTALEAMIKGNAENQKKITDGLEKKQEEVIELINFGNRKREETLNDLSEAIGTLEGNNSRDNPGPTEVTDALDQVLSMVKQLKDNHGKVISEKAANQLGMNDSTGIQATEDKMMSFTSVTHR